MKPVFKIDGKDFTKMIPESSISWSRNDLDSSKTGRTMNGTMYRRRIAIKRKLGIKCKRMTTEELADLNKALMPQFIKVTYLDPIEGETTKTFYGSSIESTTLYQMDGVTYWEDTSFSLVER